MLRTVIRKEILDQVLSPKFLIVSLLCLVLIPFSIFLNVSAFRREGFGLSVLEGMAVGTPFIGYRAGGYREIVVQGENGYLVEDKDEFVEVVVGLLAVLKAAIKN